MKYCPKITQNMRTDQNRHRSWSVFCVSAALHDRVNALVASFPLVAASTRRILLDLSAFSEGCFSSNYFLLAAYVNLVVMDYTNHYEVVPGCETKSIIDRAARIVGNFIAGKCDRGATRALFFIHLLRKAGKPGRLVEKRLQSKSGKPPWVASKDTFRDLYPLV